MLHIWHVYSTKETFPTDTKVNYLDFVFFSQNTFQPFRLCCRRGHQLFTNTFFLPLYVMLQESGHSYFYDEINLYSNHSAFAKAWGH